MDGLNTHSTSYTSVAEMSGLQHAPVLLEQATAALQVRSNGVYVDGTFGRGGHAGVVLQQLHSQGHLWLFDKDPVAIDFAHNAGFARSQVTICHASFAQLAEHLGPESADGILLDLGVSSPQLDAAERGFSFRHTGPLDMRMNPLDGQNVAQWLAHAREQDIAQVLWLYGEERHSRRIARAIVAHRQCNALETTTQLAELICRIIPPRGDAIHPATRTFQALRIYVNRELEDLRKGLDASVGILRPGGRLVVISFHSLEDRIVKQFMRQNALPPPSVRRLPSASVFVPRVRIVGKAIRPDMQECHHNPRARSAVMRVCEKVLPSEVA